MTEAQRAAMYRARRHDSAMVAHEDLKSASTTVLLASLALQLKAVTSDPDKADVARDIAARLINELCKRHDIRLLRGNEID